MAVALFTTLFMIFIRVLIHKKPLWY